MTRWCLPLTVAILCVATQAFAVSERQQCEDICNFRERVCISTIENNALSNMRLPTPNEIDAKSACRTQALTCRISSCATKSEKEWWQIWK
jgi:hypothetical protein